MTLFLLLCLFVNGQKKYHPMDQCLPIISFYILMADGIFFERSQKKYYVVAAMWIQLFALKCSALDLSTQKD